jgi:hypothetical protein
MNLTFMTKCYIYSIKKTHEYPIHVRHRPSPTPSNPHIYPPPIGNLINLMKLERGQEKEKDGRPPGLQLPDGVEDVVLVHGTPVLRPSASYQRLT